MEFPNTLERLGQLNNSEALCCTDITCNDETHSKVRDEIVLDTLCTIIEVTHESLPFTSNFQSRKMPELLPNWNTVISPLKKDSKFWHAIWISAGRPSMVACIKLCAMLELSTTEQ